MATHRQPPGGGADNQPTGVGVWRSHDPSLHEQAVKPWELLTDVPAREPFLHEMRYLSAPSFTVYEERFSCSVRLRGQSPEGFFVLAIPICLRPDTTCWKRPWSPEQIPALADGALDVRLGRGHRQLVALIAPGLARRELGQQRARRLKQVCRSRWLRSTERLVIRLRDFLLALIGAVTAEPQLLRNPETLCSIEADLIRNVAAAVHIPEGRPSGERVNAASTGRSRLVSRTLEYLRARDPVGLSIPQLCEGAGVEQRSLEYAFRDLFDLTPAGFLKLRRLHSARHRLLLANAADMAVTDIAYQEGFYHLGRFAAAYSAAFGEYPSQTLQRPCPKELETLTLQAPLGPARRPLRAGSVG